MLPTKHAAWLVAFLAVGGHAQAQFKGTAEPVAPMAPTAPVMALDLGAATAPIASAPSVGPEIAAPATAPAAAPEITGAISATTPTDEAPDAPTGRTAHPSLRGLAMRTRRC